MDPVVRLSNHTDLIIVQGGNHVLRNIERDSSEGINGLRQTAEPDRDKIGNIQIQTAV